MNQKKAPHPRRERVGQMGSMGFLGGRTRRKCSVDEYLTEMVRYVNRKNAPRK
jgi:hypothetical protein